MFFDTVRLRRSFPPLESPFPFGEEEIAEVDTKKATTKRKDTAAIFMMIVGEDVGELSYV